MSGSPNDSGSNQNPENVADSARSFSQTRSITPSPPQVPSCLNQQEVPSARLQSPAPIEARTVSQPPAATESATLSVYDSKPKIRLPDEQSTEGTDHTVTSARTTRDNRDIRLPPNEDSFVFDLSGIRVPSRVHMPAQLHVPAQVHMPDPRLDPSVPNFITRRRGILPTIEEESSNEGQQSTAHDEQDSENMSGMQQGNFARPGGASEQVRK